ncbi:LysM domain-containing protein [Lysinibacillus sp. 2017]|uniref:LysM peptidoglycan-binding domain-containing protein n=1 Tax=unclassified Lysinibacillus TaxID=2636778 RepID=UPI000D5262FE|nr:MULTISPECIES: LysM peptidoglycan-binding domain-containing protein [unclassified Lysinibacillus]AWE06967.1 LysM domain-containing protein [Lysinibacillus sp. 2017]TGN37108.1 LysM peptidoglycan-binding domain-containing protein [Lysinibacillus sp. S2017]
MAKEDYREKVEEHRQEIDLHNESEAKLSRVSRHHKKDAKKQKNPIMTVLVVIFIFIPLSILGYVLFIFDPGTKQNDVVKEDEKDQLVEIIKQDPNEVKVVESAEKDDEAEEKKDDTDAKANDEAEKERLAAEEAKKAEEQKQAKATEQKKVKDAESAQKVAAQKAKEQEEKKKAEAQKAAAQKEQKTHTVQSTDNLYRIALKYYGDGSPASIEKIKAANNLSSDSISTGQVLIINP